MSVSTHVLDTVLGRPAVGIAVVLMDLAGQVLARHATDDGGRVADLAGPLAAGTYRLRFDTGEYFAGDTFFPEVTVAFTVRESESHHHVPLLVSPYAYSTYRGS